MRISHVTIYCLPNIRAPWVVVFEPHPWGCGALRVKESSALLVFERVPSRFEQAMMADSKTYLCFTFTTEAKLLDYEDGQHEHAAEVADAIRRHRAEVDAILAQVAEKQRKKRAEERRRALPVVSTSHEEHHAPQK